MVPPESAEARPYGDEDGQDARGSQAEGFLHALFGMMRLDLSAPDYTTLSRRSQHLRCRLRPVPTGEGLHLVLDSTGLSIVGAGEWAAAKHGGRDVAGGNSTLASISPA